MNEDIAATWARLAPKFLSRSWSGVHPSVLANYETKVRPVSKIGLLTRKVRVLESIERGKESLIRSSENYSNSVDERQGNDPQQPVIVDVTRIFPDPFKRTTRH
jgi:hypothetical protein